MGFFAAQIVQWPHESHSRATTDDLPLALLFGTYWSAYQAIGVRFIDATSNSEPIWFNRKWQASFFSPAARIESFVRQKDIFTESGKQR